jgi:hypothetical protein
MKIKNKKADVPVMILVIGVVAICILAISSFVVVKGREDSLGLELLEEIHSDVEKFYFYVNAGFSKEKAAQNIGAEIIGNQLMIERFLEEGKEKFSISIKYTKKLE